MIQKLHNPKTVLYQELKNLVLRDEFCWFWNSTSHYDLVEGEYEWENFSFLSHNFLKRPGDEYLFSSPNSNYTHLAHNVFEEIVRENGILWGAPIECPFVMYRANANMTIPSGTGEALIGPPHRDHQYPHKNILIYLTDCNGGPTIVGEEKYFGQEDEVILFQGEHQGCTPVTDRRVILVFTFYDFK